jgi:peptide/nickel transport system substrate-binding protein
LLKFPYADFPYTVADYHFAIFQATSNGDIDWKSGIGTGPFVLDKYNPGVALTAHRNKNYHGHAWFDDIELLTVPDAGARTNALLSRSVDYIDRCDLKTLSRLQNTSGFAIDEVPGFAYVEAPMIVTAAPFDNVNVRLAMKYCFDRQEIVNKIFGGHATVGNDNPVARAVKFAIQPSPIHQYDPDKARFHLRKAGLSSVAVNWSAADVAFAGAVDTAVLIRERARSCGIDVTVVREPDDGYWSNVWMKKPLCFSNFSGRVTADGVLSLGYAADAAWNDTYWKNPRFNELLRAARSEADEQKRATMYAEAQSIVHDDGGAIVLAFTNYVTARRENVSHGPLNGDQEHDGAYLCKRWWFAA